MAVPPATVRYPPSQLEVSRIKDVLLDFRGDRAEEWLRDQTLMSNFRVQDLKEVIKVLSVRLSYHSTHHIRIRPYGNKAEQIRTIVDILNSVPPVYHEAQAPAAAPSVPPPAPSYSSSPNSYTSLSGSPTPAPPPSRLSMLHSVPATAQGPPAGSGVPGSSEASPALARSQTKSPSGPATLSANASHFRWATNGPPDYRSSAAPSFNMAPARGVKPSVPVPSPVALPTPSVIIMHEIPDENYRLYQDPFFEISRYLLIAAFNPELAPGRPFRYVNVTFKVDRQTLTLCRTQAQIWQIQGRLFDRTRGIELPISFENAVKINKVPLPNQLEYAMEQAKDLINQLESTKLPVDVLRAKKAVEVRPRGTNKGTTVKKVMSHYPTADFVLCIGDDKTDEDMFTALEPFPHAYTVMIEKKLTSAKYYLEKQSDVLKLLIYLNSPLTK